MDLANYSGISQPCLLKDCGVNAELLQLIVNMGSCFLDFVGVLGINVYARTYSPGIPGSIVQYPMTAVSLGCVLACSVRM